MRYRLTMSPARTKRIQWRWLIAIDALLLLNVAVFAFRAGSCADFATTESACATGPAIGLPAALAVAIGSTFAIAFCVARLARRRSKP
jgi:hypothetical protein